MSNVKRHWQRMGMGQGKEVHDEMARVRSSECNLLMGHGILDGWTDKQRMKPGWEGMTYADDCRILLRDWILGR